MNKKRFGLGFLILSILAIAFFFGGNDDVKPLEAKDKEIQEVSKVEEIESKSKVEEEKEEKQSKEQTDKAKEELEEVKEKEHSKEEKKEDTIIKKDTKKKDKYKTDPTPVGKPKPTEWQEVEKDKNNSLTATLSVSSKSILNNMGIFNKDKIDVLPEDGVIYPTKTVTFTEGESVFDVLHREMKNNKIHMEFVMTPMYNSNYIEGIHNLYEFDCGELSGWMYKVNGWFPNYGASRYSLKNGDKIEWVYTCDLGRDIGGASGSIGGAE